MAKRKSLDAVGRSLLMGLVVGAMPMAGAAQMPDSFKLGSPRVVRATASEKALYDQALATKSPAIVSQFLEQYGSSELIPSLLHSLPPFRLRRISRAGAENIDPRIYSRLRLPIRRNLATLSGPVSSTGKATPEVVPQGGQDGYGG